MLWTPSLRCDFAASLRCFRRVDSDHWRRTYTTDAIPARWSAFSIFRLAHSTLGHVRFDQKRGAIGCTLLAKLAPDQTVNEF